MEVGIDAAFKVREPLRPVAPSGLAERSLEHCADGADSPFMILVTDVRPGKRSLLPAITHVDGTARLHTVEREVNLLYWQLIHHFGELTGVPVVLNTSFNVRGQPIVRTPQEALSTFFVSGLDALIIDRFLLQKSHVE